MNRYNLSSYPPRNFVIYLVYIVKLISYWLSFVLEDKENIFKNKKNKNRLHLYNFSKILKKVPQGAVYKTIFAKNASTKITSGFQTRLRTRSPPLPNQYILCPIYSLLILWIRDHYRVYQWSCINHIFSIIVIHFYQKYLIYL